MEEYEGKRRRILAKTIFKTISIFIAIVAIIMAAWSLFTLTLVTTEVGYITVIIDPIAGAISSKGDGVSAQWFFFTKAPWAYMKKVYVAVDVVHMWTEAGRTGDFPAVGCLTKDGWQSRSILLSAGALIPLWCSSCLKSIPSWIGRAEP